MSDLLAYAKGILEEAGYDTGRLEPGATRLYFEDHCLAGVVFAIARSEDLSVGWEQMHNRFISENASRLSLSPVKAWNLYAVFLVEESAAMEALQLAQFIEEDFRSTRKIVAAGVTTRASVEAALLPILPLQHRLSLGGSDPEAMLRERLSRISTALAGLLDEDVSVIDVLDTMESHT